MDDDDKQSIHRTSDIIGFVKKIYRSYRLRGIPQEQRANTGLLNPQSRLQQLMATYLVPDPEVLWCLPAIRKGKTILQSSPIQIIFSTSSPETNHLVAMRLKKITGLPWVADFRDGWLFEPLRTIRNTSQIRKKIENYLENKVINAADKVITVNNTIARDFKLRYPHRGNHIEVISNGFDSNDFLDIERNVPNKRNRKFKIVHTGSLSASRSGTSINKVLKAGELTKEEIGDVLFAEFEFSFVGLLTNIEKEMVEASAIKENIIRCGLVPHADALSYQVNADILLLII
ncbi:glycosyltransferase, partial [Chloroflexota bacterium]